MVIPDSLARCSLIPLSPSGNILANTTYDSLSLLHLGHFSPCPVTLSAPVLTHLPQSPLPLRLGCNAAPSLKPVWITQAEAPCPSFAILPHGLQPLLLSACKSVNSTPPPPPHPHRRKGEWAGGGRKKGKGERR